MYMFVCEGGSRVRVCQATMYASRFFQMIVLRISLCPLHDVVGGHWKCIMMMYNLLVCINVHCEKVGRAPHCQSPLSYCTECSLVLHIKKEKHVRGKKYCILIVT